MELGNTKFRIGKSVFTGGLFQFCILIQKKLWLTDISSECGKVHRGFRIAAVAEELFQRIAGTHGIRTAHFQVGKFLFDRFGDCTVKFQIFFIRSGKKFRVVRFFPHAPVTDPQVHTIRPSFVVMTDDIQADPRPFFRIGRRQDLVMFPAVFDVFTQTDLQFCAAGCRQLEIVVRRFEIVVPRIVFIRMEQRKDLRNIDQRIAGIFQRGIMIPGTTGIDLLEECNLTRLTGS